MFLVARVIWAWVISRIFQPGPRNISRNCTNHSHCYSTVPFGRTQPLPGNSLSPLEPSRRNARETTAHETFVIRNLEMKSTKGVIWIFPLDAVGYVITFFAVLMDNRRIKYRESSLPYLMEIVNCFLFRPALSRWFGSFEENCNWRQGWTQCAVFHEWRLWLVQLETDNFLDDSQQIC